MGTRYRDLGFVCYIAELRESPILFDTFFDGYRLTTDVPEISKIRLIAGITALAYAGFADTARRIDLGLRLLSE